MTPEQIAQACECKDGLANIRAINKLFRECDQSHLWPIHNKFNVTERAIRKVRMVGMLTVGLEYALTLSSVISDIVNDEREW